VKLNVMSSAIPGFSVESCSKHMTEKIILCIEVKKKKKQTIFLDFRGKHCDVRTKIARSCSDTCLGFAYHGVYVFSHPLMGA
jgi:hypothetical protein